MEHRKKMQNVIKAGGSALVVLVTLVFLQRLLVPKYVDDVVEGAFIAEYYEEEKDFDEIGRASCRERV